MNRTSFLNALNPHARRGRRGMAMAVLLVVLVLVMALLAALLASSSALLSQADAQTKQDRARAQADSFNQVLRAYMKPLPAEGETDDPSVWPAASEREQLQYAFTNLANNNTVPFADDPYDNNAYFTVPGGEAVSAPEGCGDIAITLRRNTDAVIADEHKDEVLFEDRADIEYYTDCELWVTVTCTLEDGTTASDTCVYDRKQHYEIFFTDKAKGVACYYKNGNWYQDPGCTHPYPIPADETQTVFESHVYANRGSATAEYEYKRREQI